MDGGHSVSYPYCYRSLFFRALRNFVTQRSLPHEARSSWSAVNKTTIHTTTRSSTIPGCLCSRQLLDSFSSFNNMSDKKLRCALIFRLSEGGAPRMVAKYDHANSYESHGGATSESLYGGRDQDYAAAVGKVISNDPPSALTESGTLGGFKVVQSDQHQVVYGADGDGVCE